MPKKQTTESFIRTAKTVHGNFYNYADTKYVNAKTRVSIGCPEHGIFQQIPYTHLGGSGCPVCAQNRQKLTTKTFIAKALQKHDGKYSYENVQYRDSTTLVDITCKEHGRFQQRPANHLVGMGCPECARGHRYSTKTFVDKATQVHNNKYSYANVVYRGWDTPIRISCPKHGEFQQRPYLHLRGKGCKACANESLKTQPDDFFVRVNALHNNKYTYDKRSYKRITEPIRIKCPIHGWFEKIASNHAQGVGCTQCFDPRSAQEKKVVEWIKDSGFDGQITLNDRSIINPKELDIFIPSKKIAFEINGSYWHSTKFKERDFHKNKTAAALSSGVQLIHIDQRDIQINPVKTRSLILAKLGVFQTRVFARQCTLEHLTKKTCDDFLEKVHMQGTCASSVRLGLRYKENLVAVMTFGRPRFNKGHNWELLRFCSQLNTSIVGGAGKLFAGFKKQYLKEGDNIISYANKNWSNGDLYLKLGFSYLYDSPPNYFWYDKNLNRFSRYQTQKHKLKSLLGDKFVETKTETENMQDSGYHQVFDCGSSVFTYRLT